MDAGTNPQEVGTPITKVTDTIHTPITSKVTGTTRTPITTRVIGTTLTPTTEVTRAINILTTRVGTTQGLITQVTTTRGESLGGMHISQETRKAT